MTRYLTFAAVAVLLAACSPQNPAQKPAQPAAAGAAGPSTPVKFNTDLPMDEFMGHVVDPAAFAYWKGSGTEITTAGAKDLSPTDEEGWEALESAAASLIEAGNMLQLPGRARQPEGHWNAYAQKLTAEAVIAKAAAGQHDKAAVFKAGADVYQVCTACHKEYVIDPQLKAEGGEPPGKLPDIPADWFPKK